MKPLILSFFVILLGYSLFLDNDEETQLRDMSNVSSISTKEDGMREPTDSLTLYAKRVSSVQNQKVKTENP